MKSNFLKRLCVFSITLILVITFGFGCAVNKASADFIGDWGERFTILPELSTAPSLVTNWGIVYVKSDGNLHFLNDGGTDFDLTGDLTPSGDITLSSGNWIGLGSSAGRITFTDAATDEIQITGNVGIGGSPDASYRLYVSGGSMLFDNTCGIFIKNSSGTPQLCMDINGSDLLTFGWGNGTSRWGTSGSEKMRLTSTGDLLLGTTTDVSSGGGKVLVFGDNGGDPTMGTNTAGVYAKDVAGTVEMFMIDEAGNVTQQTRHAPEWPEELAVAEYPQVNVDYNKYLGVKRYIAMGKLAELVQELAHQAGLLPSDKKLVVYEKLEKREDWEANQTLQAQRRAKEIQTAQARKAAIALEIESAQSKLDNMAGEIAALDAVSELGDEEITAEEKKELDHEKLQKKLERLQNELKSVKVPKPYKKKQPPAWLKERLEKINEILGAINN